MSPASIDIYKVECQVCMFDKENYKSLIEMSIEASGGFRNHIVSSENFIEVRGNF